LAKRFCHARIQHLEPAAAGPIYLDRVLQKDGNSNNTGISLPSAQTYAYQILVFQQSITTKKAGRFAPR
jgi:hypothetical protein